MQKFNSKWHFIVILNSFKVKGGALYLAIFVSFILTLLTGLFILNTYYNRYFLDRINQRQKLVDNVNSGLTLLMNEFSSFSQSEKITIDLFNEGADQVTLGYSQWGAYNIFTSSANDGYSFYSRSALIGAKLDPSDRIGLFLADRGRYLSVSGNTFLSGKTYLPEMGVRKVFIEGQSFKGDKIVDGTTKISHSMLPPISEEIINTNFPYLMGHTEIEDSVLEYKDFAKIDTIYNPFNRSTLVLYSKSNISIINKVIIGNIRIISPGSILVNKKTKLDGIILHAKNIYLESQLAGNFQAFARDTMLIGKNCVMEYPSVAAIMDTSSLENYLHIMSGAKVEGLVFLNESAMVTDKSFLDIETDVEITGQVIWPGPVQMKGLIRGSLYCNSFILKTESAFYENHLLGARIDGDGLPNSYLGLSLRNETPVFNVIRWIQ